jgi:LPS-assembly lipoprotein
MRLAALLPAGLAIALSACGFHPMYAPQANGGPAIGPIVIEQVNGKAGHVFKAELEKLLDVERGPGAPNVLKVTMTETVTGLGFRIDESASRSDLQLSANYVLYDPAGKELVRGAATSTASYDIVASAYGEIASQDDARERAAETLAERLRAELALRLSQKRAQAANP